MQTFHYPGEFSCTELLWSACKASGDSRWVTHFPFLLLSSPGHHSVLSEQARLCHTPVFSLILWEATGDSGVGAGGETFLLHLCAALGQLLLVEPLGNISKWGPLGLSAVPRHLGIPVQNRNSLHPSLSWAMCWLALGAGRGAMSS